MTMKAMMMRAMAMTLGVLWAAGSPGASCGDRPGTPDMVSAEARDSLDAQGKRIREIVLRWRNTARNGETVRWDVEMSNRAGQVLSATPGSLRPSSTYHERMYNAYLVGPNTTRCFRIRARTGGGTSGCVSQMFSARVCATSSRSVRDVPHRLMTP